MLLLFYFIYLCFLVSDLNENQWRRKLTKSVCVWGGGGGAHRHVIYVPSVKNQYKQVVFGYGYLLTAIYVSLLKLSTR